MEVQRNPPIKVEEERNIFKLRGVIALRHFEWQMTVSFSKSEPIHRQDALSLEQQLVTWRQTLKILVRLRGITHIDMDGDLVTQTRVLATSAILPRRISLDLVAGCLLASDHGGLSIDDDDWWK